MTPTERSLRLSAAMSEREMRMYAGLDTATTALMSASRSLRDFPVIARRAERAADRCFAVLAAIDAEILSTHSDPGPAPITTGA